MWIYTWYAYERYGIWYVCAGYASIQLYLLLGMPMLLLGILGGCVISTCTYGAGDVLGISVDTGVRFVDCVSASGSRWVRVVRCHRNIYVHAMYVGLRIFFFFCIVSLLCRSCTFNCWWLAALRAGVYALCAFACLWVDPPYVFISRWWLLWYPGRTFTQHVFFFLQFLWLVFLFIQLRVFVEVCVEV